MGSTGVGKTSLLYLLLSKGPQHQKIIKVVCINESGEWKEVSKNEYQDMIAKAVSVLHEKLNSKGKGIDNLSEILSHVIGEDILEEEQRMKLGDKPQSQVTLSTVVQEVTSGVTRLVGGSKKSPCLPDKLLYLTECGGQLAYLDLTPVFIYDTTATLFVHRLLDNVDEHPLKIFDTTLKPLTTAEVIKTMLHEGGKYIAVGTHKDLASDYEESIKENNKKLAGIASSLNPAYLCKDSMKMFQVNTKNPGSDDKKEANKIRTCIEKDANLYEIPILWFILWLLLQALALKLGREVLSIEECICVSNSLGFSKGELDAALTFFDKLNTFLYKKIILPGVVFTNSEVPLDKLRPVIEKLHHFRIDYIKEMNHPLSTQWQNYSESGILTLNLLEEFKENYIEEIFTANDFLMLLESLLVVFQLSKNEYFFPASLSLLSKAKTNSYLKSCRITNIAALVVQFSTERAPPGVYCCSVCHLQRYSGWKLVRKPHIKPRRTGLSAEFSHPGLEEVKTHFKLCKVPKTHFSHPQMGGIKPPIKQHSTDFSAEFSHPVLDKVKPHVKPRKASGTHYSHPQMEGIKPPSSNSSNTDFGMDKITPPVKPLAKISNTDIGVEEVKPPVKPRAKYLSTDFGMKEVKPPIKPRSKCFTTSFRVEEVSPPVKPCVKNSSPHFGVKEIKPPIKPRSKCSTTSFDVEQVKPPVKPRVKNSSTDFGMKEVKPPIKPRSKCSTTSFRVEEVNPSVKPCVKNSSPHFGVKEIKPPIKPRSKCSTTSFDVEQVKPPVKPRVKNSSTDFGMKEVKPPIKPRSKCSTTSFCVEEVKPPIELHSKCSTTSFCVEVVKPPTKPRCKSSSRDFVTEVVKPPIKPRSKGSSTQFPYPKMEEVKPIIKPRGKVCGTQIPHPRIEMAKPPIKPRNKGCIAQFPHPRMEEVKPPIKPRSKGFSSPQLFPSRIHEVKPLIKQRSKSYVTEQSIHSPIYRNCLEFTKVGRPGSVTFIDHFAFFVVCVNVDTTMMLEDELINHCQTIKSEILAAVEAALVNTHHESTSRTIGFLCPKQDDFCSPEWHVAHVSKCNKLWKCSKNSAVFNSLTPDQTLWLPETG